MSDPVVSYVVAAYNHEAYVGALVQSIRDQTFDRIELVVVDDGSTDNTVAVARNAAGDDPRIRVHAEPNRGVVAARNDGIGRSSAPFISVVDSDERLPADRTAKMVAALQAEPTAALVYGDADIVRLREGRTLRFFEIYPPVPGPFSESLFCNYCFVPAGAVMFRRDIFLRTGPFWGPAANTDYLKWIELGMHGDAICLPDEILGTWVLHGGNISQGNAAERCAQYDELCKGLVALTNKHPGFAAKLGPARIKRRCSRCYQMAAFYAARERNWPLAAEQIAIAARYDRSPTNLAMRVSTLPLVRYASGIFYDLAARIRLRETAASPNRS